jgi:hypothetical protein
VYHCFLVNSEQFTPECVQNDAREWRFKIKTSS